MKYKSSRVLQSVTLMSKLGKGSPSGTWAEKQVDVIISGTDEPAQDIGLTLIRKGVSRLHIYDPRPVANYKYPPSSALAYRAGALAQRLSKESGNSQTKITGHPFSFNAIHAFACELAILINPDDAQRAFCKDHFQTKTPYIVVTLDPNGEQGTVVAHAAWSCAVDCIPTSADDSRKDQIMYANGTKDVYTRLLALVDDAVDNLVAGRELPWPLAQVWPMDKYDKYQRLMIGMAHRMDVSDGARFMDQIAQSSTDAAL